MKKLLVILFLGALLSACSNPKSQQYLGLKGGVESVKDFKHEALNKFGEAEIGDLGAVEVYKFDTKGYLIEYSTYDRDGDCVVNSKNEYEGDECIKSTFINKSFGDTVISSLVERKGNIRVCEIKKGDDISTAEFNQSDTYLCATYKNADNTHEIQEKWFDKYGNVIEFKMKRGGEVVYWTKSKFEGNNEVQTEYLKGGESGISTYSYSDYDDTGNWTKKVSYLNGEPEYIVKREIKYAK